MKTAKRAQKLLATVLIASAVMASTPAAAQDIVTGLRGHWFLTETGGTAANDLSSYNLDGTYTNGPALATSTPVTLHGALAANFDGFNDYVAIPSESTYDFTGAFTVAAWIKVDLFDAQLQAIICKGNTAWRIQREEFTNQVQFAVDGLTPNKVVSVTSVNDGAWHHVVGVYTPGQLRIYIDGALNAVVGVAGTPIVNNLPIEIARNGEAAGREFDGSIYDVRVYDRALSANDVIYLTTQGKPIGVWKLDETSGTTAADSSGLNQTGTLTGAASWTSAIRNNGHQFNYTNGDDYFQLPNSTPLDYVQSQSFTLAAWFKPLSTPPGSGSNNNASYAILAKAGLHTGIYYKNNSAFQIDHLLTGDIAATATTPASAYPAGRWYHVAGIVDRAAGTTRIYVNGALIQTSNFTPNTASRNYGATPWRIGIASPGAATYRWPAHGIIDDARIYIRALSASEVAELYGFLAHWKLNETAGTAATDSSPMANNGTYTNGVVLNSSGPYPGAGSRAADFDGLNDYVAVPNESRYDSATGAVTVAAWMRVDQFDVHEQAIVTKGDTSWRLQRDLTNNGVAFTCRGLTTNRVASTIPVNDGPWHHVVGRYDGSQLQLYVDGKLANSVSSSGNVDMNDQPVEIARNSEAAGREFDGSMYDVRIYNRALLTEEIAELYGLTGQWRFSEGIGTVAADSSLMANNANLVGGAAWTSNCAGNAALLTNGAGGIAQTAAAFSGPSEGSVAFWMRSPGTPAALSRVFGSGGDWECRHQTDGTLAFDLCGEGVPLFVTTTPLNEAGRWYHVVAVFDAADDSYSIYIDGELNRTGTNSNAMNAQPAATLSFGTRTGSTEYWAGALRDFHVFNRRLSTAEIAQLYGLVAHWKLDETSGTAAADSSGAGRAGTVIGTPQWVTGKIDKALRLDGASCMSAASLMGRPKNVTLSAWASLTTADSGGAEVISLADYLAIRLNQGSTSRAFFYNGSTWLSASTNQTFSPGWHHFAAVLNDDQNTFKFFVDGVEVASTSTTASIPYAGLGASTVLGRHGNGQTTYDFTGKIDDARVYNRAMCPTEILQLFNQGDIFEGVRIIKWVEIQ